MANLPLSSVLPCPAAGWLPRPWTGREESVQTGWAEPGNGPCHDGMCPCRELLGNTAAAHGPSDRETRLSSLSFNMPQKMMGKVKPEFFPAQDLRSIKQCLKALGTLWFRPPQFFLQLMSVHLHPAAGWLTLWWTQYTLYEHVLHQADLPERLPLLVTVLGWLYDICISSQMCPKPRQLSPFSPSWID